MRVSATAGMTSITVQLELGGVVKLREPELLIGKGADAVLVPNPVITKSTATWGDIAFDAEAAAIVMQLYWRASDPNHDQWNYQATILVTDQADQPLPGHHGDFNPSILRRQIGTEIPSQDYGAVPIGIFL